MDSSIVEGREAEVEEHTVAKNLIPLFNAEHLDIEADEGDEDICGTQYLNQECAQNALDKGKSMVSGIGMQNQDITEVQPLREVLVGATASSEREAFHIYNDYAYKVGFSVRYSKIRHRCKSKGGGLCMRQFCCWKAGFKQDKGSSHKDHTNVDVRTGCKAFIQFYIDDDGKWIATRHDFEHNHALCSPSKRHLLPSHREVSKEDVLFIKQSRESGIGVADAYRVLKKQAGGSPSLGYGLRDVYNKLNQLKDRTFEGGDAHSLIEIFNRRMKNEVDFFSAFELDANNCLVSFFWRDKQMLDDYVLFGDLVVFDTTYRTNKYDMICTPFVGMNHHLKNIMFGCGFLMNEKIESFVWLFKTFLKSMGGKHPITMMTDQAFSMASAIKMVFPHARHRLCCWHIIENSRKNIGGLRSSEGFIKIFNRVLMECDTVDEFQHFWERIMTKYNCSNNRWLCNLYSLREKWCPDFSKEYFSGGVLSSQRSETTNRSLKRRLRATADLCDFYNIFCDVVSEWRSKENGEDHRCSKGTAKMVFPSVNILKHALSVYTIEAFLMFEKEFIDGASHSYKEVGNSSCHMSFEVWGAKAVSESQGEESSEFRHIVTFNNEQGIIDCTCKMFTKVGLLCSHCLRVLHACCIEQVPNRYINKRWCKGIKDGEILDLGNSVGKEPIVFSSVWKTQMMRKMNSLITASQINMNTRAHCEKHFIELKKLIEFDVGSIHCEDDTHGKNCNSSQNVLNPPGSRQKGVRNKRFKSIVEKKCAQVKRRKTNKLSMEVMASSTLTPQNELSFPSVPSYIGANYSQMIRQSTASPFNLPSTSLHIQHHSDQGASPLMSFHPAYHFNPSNGNFVFMRMTVPPVFPQWHAGNFLPDVAPNDKH